MEAIEFDSYVENGVIVIPAQYQKAISSSVRVILMPIEKKTSQKASFSSPDIDILMKPVKHSAFGRLSAYANPSLIPLEKGAWEKEVAEKYVLH